MRNYTKASVVLVLALIATLALIWNHASSSDDATAALKRSVFTRIPESFKLLKVDRHGLLKERYTLFQFKIAPRDLQSLLEAGNAAEIGLSPSDESYGLLRVLSNHIPSAVFPTRYKAFQLKLESPGTIYLFVSSNHSDGVILRIRY